MDADSSVNERIMDAAEEVLRRYGPAKTNIVDIAEVLGMSHANIYRYFPSKKALLDAVAARWLHKISAPLQAIAEDTKRPAAERLAAWFDALRRAKQEKVRRDPELFRVYHGIVEKAHEVVGTHVAALLAQVERIIADGVAGGEFAPGVLAATVARTFLMATVQFHHPALVTQDPLPTEEDAHALFSLLLIGLRGTARPVPVKSKR